MTRAPPLLLSETFDTPALNQTVTTKGGFLTHKNARYLATNSSKWNPNDFSPKFLDTVTKPFHEGMQTARGAKRAMTLERSFDREVWYHPR